MLSYRHAFHAGNFADVFKHYVLTLLLRQLWRKDKPFRYLDTHAGAGLYDLRGGMADKNREHEGGIVRVWNAQAVPEGVRAYLDTVRAFNPDGNLRFYPGSPRIARHWLRAQDRMTLCDLHTTESRALAAEFAGDRPVTVRHLDGYQALKAFLPPVERRGLVLTHPAYERKDERERLSRGVGEALKRWPTGIYAIWYPIQDQGTADGLVCRLERLPADKMLRVELCLCAQALPLRLNGTGLILINPPWQLDKTLAAELPWLWRCLSPEGAGGFRVDWLKGPESLLT